ncbi:ATP-binding cassette domain-containing protein [Echinimonas agarilytica]|uniref:Probable ATP-binding protein YheS n=1 Tax=Echinimonas agarilytica TaxID=1215918 RepID=A0AA41W4C8_9GAMM|nr:ATP-binding cassette domain-containing protein [Echinimonas agarilytica]MCM2678389.1 ATP-binding cassette domain-containing protein [Echinimonas agarilytica]
MIQCQQIDLSRGTKQLLSQANLHVPDGHKFGLVGSNGCGKSTLFALLLGHIEHDQGDVTITPNWRIGHVAQETPALDISAIDYVISGDREYMDVADALDIAEQQEDGTAIGELHSKMAAIDGYTIRARTGAMLSGLGFTHEKQLRPVRSFSGGWRMRLNLAQALICRADLLLLDEPTNHLDLDAVIWLERWLQRFDGTLLMISHDRTFLDNVIQSIAHVDAKSIITYTGNYSSFERQRAERLAQQAAVFEKQERHRAHLQSFVDRFRAKASKAKQAQSRIKALEKLEAQAPAHAGSPFNFEIRSPKHLPNPLVNLEKADLGYADNVILNGVNISLVPGSRVGLIGPNGAGKSTLIKSLAGSLSLCTGEREASSKLQIGYFAQHQLEQLDGNLSPLEAMTALSPEQTEQALRNYLGGFNINGDDALRKLESMSGGEKARVVLALICWQQPNLLLMDEPTNHLDLEMRHALELALQSYEGALLVISHDRELIASTTDELWLVAHGKVEPYDGDLNDYQSYLQSKSDEDVSTDNAPKPSQNKKEQKRLDAEFRQRTKPLRQAVEKNEKAMAKQAEQLAQIELEMADPALYESENKARLNELIMQRTQAQIDLEAHEEQWLEASSELEELTESHNNNAT